MLSYRHAFHAGNFADVLKHSALSLVLEYFTEKQKGFSYIDSHSGAGMYSLLDEYAQKTGEFKNGIDKLLGLNDLPEALVPYLDIVEQLNNNIENNTENGDNTLDIYPGSPGIAKQIMRRQDAAHLFELHPTDNALLNQFCERWKKAQVGLSDGYKGVLGQLPPPTRRGIVLIDPPYEIKNDYEKAVATIITGYKRFGTGCYILWYPVVKREFIHQMAEQFKNSEVRNLIQVEYCQAPDNDEYGMTGTGLFIVNPPWKLAGQLNDILSCMKQHLGNQDSGYSISELVPE